MSRFWVVGMVSCVLMACGGGGSDSTTTPQPPGPAAVATVSVTLSVTSLLPGRSATATAEMRSAAGDVLSGRSVSWSSSNTAIATVDGSGNVTAVATGTSTISATSEGKTGSATLTVLQAPVATVSVSLVSGQVIVGGTTNASAITKDDRGNTLTGRTVTFSSSAPSVATVNASGVVTAVAPGATNIVATSEGQSGTASLTVLPQPASAGAVTIAPPTRVPGGTSGSKVTVSAVNGVVLSGRTVSYESSAPSVATVNANGVVTALAPGSANISATSEGKSGVALMTVLPPVTSVTISGATRVKVGDTYSYSVTAKTADGAIVSRPLVWSTSDASRATISQSGVLLPTSTGAFRIQVTIDGSLWEATYSAYDWMSFTSGGTLFTTIEADNTIIGRRNIAEYPSLVFSCNTSGNFFTWVSFTNFITSSGAVAMSFDDAAPFSATWNELSPDFTTLWKPGNNGAVKAFALQIAASRQFGFAFTEFLGSAKAMIFRVTGLSSRLAPIIAVCPSNAIVTNALIANARTTDADTTTTALRTALRTAMRAAMAQRGVAGTASASAAALRIERNLRAAAAAAANGVPTLIGPTIEALRLSRSMDAQAAVRRR